MADRDDVGLTLEVRKVDVWDVLTVTGELDMRTAPALKERLDELGTGSAPKVALDLSAVPFMDSSSVAILIMAYKRLVGLGGVFALIGASGSPQKVLHITGIDRVIPVYAQVSDLPAT